ncbi:MAG: hypothetical protein JWR50_438 [Mucilaginibacter sp.]|nr:hypothetical protein [Mucilaginibacter sp.]
MISIRQFFLFVIIIPLSGPVCYGQLKKDIIEYIRHSYTEINKDKLYNIVKLENTAALGPVTDEGNSLTGYFNSSTIRKIKVWVGLSFGIRQYEYYLKDNQVFFIYEREEDFQYDSKTGEMLHYKPKLAFEGRYYLNEEKIVKIKINGKKRFGERPVIYSLKDVLSNIKRYIKTLQVNL